MILIWLLFINRMYLCLHCCASIWNFYYLLSWFARINKRVLFLEEKVKIQYFSVGDFLLFFSFVVLLNFCLLMYHQVFVFISHKAYRIHISGIPALLSLKSFLNPPHRFIHTLHNKFHSFCNSFDLFASILY